MPFIAMEPGQKRYDRQVRIWGPHGQAQLEGASICLLNASATGSEALKNLVLGGISAFTIVDACKVEARDLGNNFLLDRTCLGRSKAQSVTELLKELNPSVSGSFVEDSVTSVMKEGHGFFQPFQLVIATQMSQADACQLDSICRAQNTKLILARSYGLTGYVRISTKEHVVVESRPEHPEEDLRLHAPWPELQEWAASFDLSSLSEGERSHVPFVVLLIKAAEAWKQSHSGNLPKSYQDKQEFKELLRSWQHKIDGIPIEDENFKEALENRRIFRLASPASLPDEVSQVLSQPAASTSGASSDRFWVLAAALKEFIDNEGNGNLPLEGSIPDMTAKTATFLELQRIYRERAERDVAALEAHVVRLAQEKSNIGTKVPSSYIRLFAKNARNLRAYQYPSLSEELEKGSIKHGRLHALLGQEDSQANTALYLLLQAADEFQAIHQRFPGSSDNDIEEDVTAMSSSFRGMLAKCGHGNGLESTLSDYVTEIVRAGASELHVIASVVGGIASQEAIKLLTAQFLPLTGTVLYNGIACTSSVINI